VKQLKEWLIAVSNSDSNSKDSIDPRFSLILNHVQKNIDRDSNNNNNNNNNVNSDNKINNESSISNSSSLLTKKRVYASSSFSSSMFGTTTMKGRKKVPPTITNNSNNSNNSNIANIGQYFVKLNFSEIQSIESYDYSLFREARSRRSKLEFSHYEANLLREQDRYTTRDSSNLELLSASRKNVEPSKCLEDVVFNNSYSNNIVNNNDIVDDFENFLGILINLL
jgi:hypothetical protein